jgi:hypothetical protein
MTTRKELKTHLEGHDWWYGMSDDHRYYRRGADSLAGLRQKIREIVPPWTLGELRSWSLRMVTSRYDAPQADGWAYPLQGNGAPVKADQLIDDETDAQIQAWLDDETYLGRFIEEGD